MIRWFGRVFDTIWDLTGMRDTLTSVAEASGPQRSLTRLQRSARGNSIPKASRDSTFGVYPFLTNIASMLADLANSASQASARSIDPVRPLSPICVPFTNVYRPWSTFSHLSEGSGGNWQRLPIRLDSMKRPFKSFSKLLAPWSALCTPPDDHQQHGRKAWSLRLMISDQQVS